MRIRRRPTPMGFARPEVRSAPIVVRKRPSSGELHRIASRLVELRDDMLEAFGLRTWSPRHKPICELHQAVVCVHNAIASLSSHDAPQKESKRWQDV